MDIVERLRVINESINQEAASEIVELRIHAAKMRQVCQALAERLYAIDPTMTNDEDAAIGSRTFH